jgi:PAS domain S-box-containing protein
VAHVPIGEPASTSPEHALAAEQPAGGKLEGECVDQRDGGSGHGDPGPKQIAMLVQDSEDLLGLAQEAGQLGLFEWRVQDGTVRLSPKSLSLYGLDDFDGRYQTWLQCLFREDVTRVVDLMDNAFATQARNWQAEFRITRRSDGALRWMEARNVVFYDEQHRPIRVVGVNVDVTDRKRALVQLHAFTESLEERVKERTRELESEHEARRKAEESLRQVQKMEAIGQLSGGIAHDFNNMLGVITASLDLMRRRIKNGDFGIERYMDAAQKATERAATLTHRLLAFARQQPLAPGSLDANRMIATMSDLLRSTLGEHIRIETVSAAGLWTANADGHQLESAILNVAINARDAMPEGGKLTIETANAYLDEAYCRQHADVAPGQFVMIAISDTGTGMKPDVALRAFDPFFTTKPAGKGTGLGLSQVYGFVKQSHGHVSIYSETGAGTTVKIYLPRLVGDAKEIKRALAQPLRMGDAGEVILVVEDDALMRRLTTEALRELGYTIVDCENAAGALAILDRMPDIKLLFTDVVMPEVNGRKLADQALSRRPGLKVLFTTGYTPNAVVHGGVLDAGVNFLSKPFTLEQLASKVRAVLDG